GGVVRIGDGHERKHTARAHVARRAGAVEREAIGRPVGSRPLLDGRRAAAEVEAAAVQGLHDGVGPVPGVTAGATCCGSGEIEDGRPSSGYGRGGRRAGGRRGRRRGGRGGGRRRGGGGRGRRLDQRRERAGARIDGVLECVLVTDRLRTVFAGLLLELHEAALRRIAAAF